jgi:hypothetical protein
MLPLPEPKRGGDVRKLARVLNLSAANFVLAVGWLLQVLNPIGAYPLICVSGQSEAGKTTICRMLLRVADPNRTGLRRIKTIEDLLIAAKNNWALGLDNLSAVWAMLADALCTLSTGIATGGRKLYTDDEESAFEVQRPVLLNGIPAELVERSDLASRTIKMDIVPIRKEDRIGDAELNQIFEEVWPEVLGALLDGLVGAMRGWRDIRVAEPARLMDFEKWAEAGCRAMGFREWEFVDRYRENRDAAMAAAAEAHPIGRAVLKLMGIKKHREGGWRGSMSSLYEALDLWREGKYWPSDPTRLASAMRRVAKPLEVVGLEVDVKQDLRKEGLGQKGVVIQWRK